MKKTLKRLTALAAALTVSAFSSAFTDALRGDINSDGRVDRTTAEKGCTSSFRHSFRISISFIRSYFFRNYIIKE